MQNTFLSHSLFIQKNGEFPVTEILGEAVVDSPTRLKFIRSMVNQKNGEFPVTEILGEAVVVSPI